MRRRRHASEGCAVMGRWRHAGFATAAFGGPPSGERPDPRPFGQGAQPRPPEDPEKLQGAKLVFLCGARSLRFPSHKFVRSLACRINRHGRLSCLKKHLPVQKPTKRSCPLSGFWPSKSFSGQEFFFCFFLVAGAVIKSFQHMTIYATTCIISYLGTHPNITSGHGSGA